MRICILSWIDDLLLYDTGGSIRIKYISEGLHRLGYDVQIIIPGIEDKLYVKNSGYIINVIKGYFPQFILNLFQSILKAKKTTSLYFYDIFFLIKCSSIIKASDMIQIEAPWSGGMLLPFIKFLFHKPVVIDAHDVFQSLRLNKRYDIRTILETLLEKFCYRLTDLILVVSEVEKDILVNYGVNDQKIHIIPNGVDINFYNDIYEREENEIIVKYNLDSYKRVIFVGNMEYYPNEDAARLIINNIAPKVCGTMDDVKFLLVGRQPDLKPKDDNIVITGVVDNVAAYLNVSDVAIAPLFRGSGTRLKILEYFASGIPVVSTTIGSEGLKLRNNVHLIIEDNVEKFISAIERLLTDNAMAFNLVENARCFVSENYSWNNVCEKLNLIYSNYK